MRAVQITAYGGPEVTAMREVSKPEVGADEVLVKVSAAGVNPVDWKVREGYLKDVMPLPLPATLGSDLAGIVEAVGSGVSGFSPGDEVHGSTGLAGAFAEYAVIKAAFLAKKPSTLSMAEAAALPVAVATTFAALRAGEAGPGKRILIHAAAGGVGHVAVQMAKAQGAEVTALASPGNIEFVKSLGADRVLDRTKGYEDLGKVFDMVLDAFGAESQARSWPLLKKGGVLVSLSAPPSEDEAKKHDVRATMVFGAPNGEDLAAADRLIETGKLKVRLARTYKFEEFAAALDETQQGKVVGKVVLAI